MTRGLFLVTGFAALLLAGSARGDQCMAVSPKQALAAEKILKQSAQAVGWCEPCGEKRPGKPFAVKTVTVGKFDAKLAKVLLNRREIDLAYVFVRKSTNESFKNLAKLAGCKATEVSAEIKNSAGQR